MTRIVNPKNPLDVVDFDKEAVEEPVRRTRRGNVSGVTRRGRPPDLTPPDFTDYDTAQIIVRGVAPFNGILNDHVQRYRRLCELIARDYPGQLEVVRLTENGRRIGRRKNDLPRIGVDDLIAVVRQFPGDDLSTYAMRIYGDIGWRTTDDLARSCCQRALSRVQVLIALAMKDFLIVRRYRPDMNATSIYFTVGHFLADNHPKTRADARLEAQVEQAARMKLELGEKP